MTSPPQTLVEWLDDLCVRFLLNLPASELSSVPRLCFQVEEAQWFYEDFVRPAVQASGHPPLPHLPLRQFCLLLFQHCPLLSGFTDAQHLAAYEEFLSYKVRVPVRGAILLDEKMERLVLVRGWKKGSSWSFPRGKINKDEKDLDCAIREVWEETGFDIASSGLLPTNYQDEDAGGVKYIDITMREQHIRLFVFRGVSLDTHFETQTRKEISKIAWYAIKDLPGFKKQSKQTSHHSEVDVGQTNKFYMVAPFLGPLKKWISLQRKLDLAEAEQAKRRSVERDFTATEDETEDQVDLGVNVNASREDELRRLLSIGVSPTKISAPRSDNHAGNLLAMLRGSGTPNNGNVVPQTPLDQINAFPPPEPETPQPQHARQPSLPPYAYYQQPPQFPLSPQRLHHEQQQRNHSLPTSQVFGNQQGYPPHVQPQLFQRQHVPYHLPQHQPFSPPPGMHAPPPNFPQNNAFPGPWMAQSQSMPTPQQFAQQLPQINPALNVPQGPQGPLGTGPSVPNASQLPPPRLNAQKMSLLDTFKGSTATTRPSNFQPGPAGHRPASAHQNALLDLFKPKSSGSTMPAELAASPLPLPANAQSSEEPPLSPTLTDVTEKPAETRPVPASRKSTLNEITRTLPMNLTTKGKVASPSSPSPVSAVSGDAFGPALERRGESISSSAEHKKKLSVPSITASPPPVRILQRPGSRSPMAQIQPSSPKTASPSTKDRPGSNFTMLTRPSVAERNTNVSPVLSSNQDTPKATPSMPTQVLQRPKSKGTDVGLGVASSADDKNADSEAKKEHLLALFGKSSQPKQEVQAPDSTSIVDASQSREADGKNTLLDLLNKSTKGPPPEAPKLSPKKSTQHQSLLLNLFQSKSSTESPGSAETMTPISPFTLGTPAQATVTDKNSEKEFLMGYLQGIVRSESYRGA